jgi:hypothetical protein
VAGDTEMLPPSAITDYSCEVNRCAVELSLRALGCHLLRVRLRATSGVLTAAGVLRLELSAAPVRTSVPFLDRCLLRAVPAGVRLLVRASTVEPVSVPTRADGYVSPVRVGDDEPAEWPTWPLRLIVRTVRAGDDAVLLAVRGRFPRPRRPSASVLSALRPWMRVDAAVEFSR